MLTTANAGVLKHGQAIFSQNIIHHAHRAAPAVDNAAPIAHYDSHYI